MGKLVTPTQKLATQMIDEATYQIFSHFMATSIVMIVFFVAIGLLTGSMLAALAIGSFAWALLAVGCAKYCEMVANQREQMQS